MGTERVLFTGFPFLEDFFLPVEPTAAGTGTEAGGTGEERSPAGSGGTKRASRWSATAFVNLAGSTLTGLEPLLVSWWWEVKVGGAKPMVVVPREGGGREEAAGLEEVRGGEEVPTAILALEKRLEPVSYLNPEPWTWPGTGGEEDDRARVAAESAFWDEEERRGEGRKPREL